MTRRISPERLDDHPNLLEIVGILGQVGQIPDADLPLLARGWTNSAFVASARDRALQPDSPLVLEVLTAFESVSELFAEDLQGEATYVTVDPALASLALKAILDAVAGAYARPILSRTEHSSLLAAWRQVYPNVGSGEPDLGPNSAAVKALLGALPRLAMRCHDPEGMAAHEQLVQRSFVGEADRAQARAQAFDAAVLTSRRRLWTLVRRSGAEGLSRPCPTCTVRNDRRDQARVLTLCVDAACALLVADAVSDEVTALLTQPVACLIPLQREG